MSENAAPFPGGGRLENHYPKKIGPKNYLFRVHHVHLWICGPKTFVLGFISLRKVLENRKLKELQPESIFHNPIRTFHDTIFSDFFGAVGKGRRHPRPGMSSPGKKSRHRSYRPERWTALPAQTIHRRV